MRKYFREIFIWIVTTALTSGPAAAQLPKKIQLGAVQAMALRTSSNRLEAKAN